MYPPPQPLCIADDASFWPWLTWADFTDRAKNAATTVIVPVVGFCDWGLGHAYDAEEQVITRLLQAALASRPAAASRMLMIPPLRFVIGSNAGCICTVTPPVAHKFIDETLETIAVAGFTRVLLCNSSPWNEELIDAAARDIRISRGLQMFCINLSALDLDFHPVRSRSRRQLQTLITYFTGRTPETADVALAPTQPLGFAEDMVQVLAGPAASAEEVEREGRALFAAASTRLAALFEEINSRPPLPRGGALEIRTYP
jgi:creatinine amidohydrolase